jgi:hypothetical protein
MAEKKKSLFQRLSEVNVSGFAEKKGQFTYLSWAWAVTELKKVAPEAYWKIHEWGLEGNKQPYQQTEAGCFVKVTVIAEGIEMTQVHPVLDHRNNTVKTPNAFEVNTSIMRCLTKAISLHGLGLYIYAGEDLPAGESQPTKTKSTQTYPTPALKKGVITGHNPNMKNGEKPITDNQINYIKKLKSDFEKDFGNKQGIIAIKNVLKTLNLEGIKIDNMTMQQGSDAIEGLIQNHANDMRV